MEKRIRIIFVPPWCPQKNHALGIMAICRTLGPAPNLQVPIRSVTRIALIITIDDIQSMLKLFFREVLHCLVQRRGVFEQTNAAIPLI